MEEENSRKASDPPTACSLSEKENKQIMEVFDSMSVRRETLLLIQILFKEVGRKGIDKLKASLPHYILLSSSSSTRCIPSVSSLLILTHLYISYYPSLLILDICIATAAPVYDTLVSAKSMDDLPILYRKLIGLVHVTPTIHFYFSDPEKTAMLKGIHNTMPKRY